MPRPPHRILAAVLLIALAGCGGGDDDDRAGSSARRAPPPAAERPAPDAAPSAKVSGSDEAVIRGWSDALRDGDVDGASRFFALPTSVSNGTPPVRLRTLGAVRLFNQALPCGAKLIATERSDRRYVVATFRLTERPGEGECGSGTGGRAKTAFLIRDGKIVQWLRVPDGQPALPNPDAQSS